MSKQKIPITDVPYSVAELQEAIQTGSLGFTEENGNTYLWITPKAVNKDKTPLSNDDILEAVEDLARKHDVPLEKKRYRKPEQRPEPGLSSDHEKNRSSPKFQSRIDPETSRMVDEFIKATGVSKKDLTVAALRAYIESHTP